MPETLDQFKENVRTSFKKAKEDINELHSKLDELKSILQSIQAQNSPQATKTIEKKEEHYENHPNLPPIPEKTFSTGNKGVYSFTHSFNNHSFIIHSDIRLFLSRLTKQELLTFLTLYQLEEDQASVTYTDLAQKVGLSEGCIRTYISSLIKKGAPVIKQKYNNKTVFLLVLKEFRELKLKQLLIDQYYKNDPHQKRLSEEFK